VGKQQFANEVAQAFILLGVAMIVIATIRFFRIAREIDRDEVINSSGSLFDLALAALLLLLLGMSLSLYAFRALLSSI
jgi:uncharacterized membrane protein YidH (DUF202 family)